MRENCLSRNDMSMKRFLSVWEKLLIAAFILEQSGKTPFSAEDLVVKAWQIFPDTFGLSGYLDANNIPKYPDSNRVFAEIMGSKPIRKYGLLKKVGAKMYQLTEAGRTEAMNLIQNNVSTQLKKTGLPREVKRELKRLLESSAVEKYKSAHKDELTFFDACMFWKISSRSSAVEFFNRTANVEKILKTAAAVLEDTGKFFEHGRKTYTLSDLTLLLEVHKELLERFKDEIEIIKRRVDER